MKFPEIIKQIKLQIDSLEENEESNRQEQVKVAEKIEQLKQEIVAQEQLQTELDHQALDICRQIEELKDKREKLCKIELLSSEFQDLQSELASSPELLDTLYSSVSALTSTTSINPDPKSAENKNNNNSKNKESKNIEIKDIPTQFEFVGQDDSEQQENVANQGEKEQPENLQSSSQKNESKEEMGITIADIKAKLPNAERLYQNLVAKHLEQYHTYQNLIIDGLDLIWCSVAFVAFGKETYKSMSLKHHPDRDPDKEKSAIAMQLINTAWEISQEHSPS